LLIGGETENISWTQKPLTRFVIETFQLITRAVCCGCVSNLIGRRTINIPEIILGVHGLMGFTVKFTIFLSLSSHWTLSTLLPLSAYRTRNHNKPSKYDPAQWLERPTGVQKVVHSIPVRDSALSLSNADDMLNIQPTLKIK